MGGPQLGEFEAGAVAAVAGAGTSVVIGGIGTLLAAGFTARWVPAISRFRTDVAFDHLDGQCYRSGITK